MGEFQGYRVAKLQSWKKVSGTPQAYETLELLKLSSSATRKWLLRPSKKEVLTKNLSAAAERDSEFGHMQKRTII